MTTNNAWNSQDPAQESKGGTNQSTYTQGDILIASASNTLSKLPVGSSGQVLTSDGTDPAWSTPAGAGSLILLEHQDAAVSATIDFTSQLDDTYRVYYYTITQAVPASGTNTLQLQYSRNNGSSWNTDDYSFYVERLLFSTGALTSSNGQGQTRIGLTPTSDVGNTAGEGVNIDGFLFAPTTPNAYTRTTFWGNYESDSTGVSCDNRGSGTSSVITDVDAIRFSFASGNITSGSFTLYGVANS